MNPPTGLDRDAEQACLLLQEYSFDLGGYTPDRLIVIWQKQLDAESSWIRSAVVEALYQGRYKALSVEQILRVWKRRGHPLRHFNHEFERVVFGPVDPTASKYAPMTTLRPSELLTPQKEPASKRLPNSPTPPDTPSASAPTAANPGTAEPPCPDPAAATDAAETSSAVEDAGLPQAQIPTRLGPALPSESTPSPMITVHSPAFNQAEDPLRNPSEPIHNQPEPIRKFVPPPESSEFYYRLQSVARHPFYG